MTPEATPGTAPPASREACVELLDSLLCESRGGPRGIAVFVLDCACTASSGELRRARRAERLTASIHRRLRAAAPFWHHLQRGDGGEFVVVAEGLVDGAAVLSTAARLVHAFDDALHAADLAERPEVVIGIACAPQQGRSAQALLEAAQAGLRESLRFAHGSSCLDA